MKTPHCARVKREIPFYVEGESEPLDSLRIASHLASCAPCRREEARAREILETLRSMPSMEPPEPPREISSAVMGALRSIRASIGSGAALKWSALGLLLAALIGPGLFPDATVDLGVRVVTQLGELVDVQSLLADLVDLLPGLVPPLTSAMEMLREGVHSPGSAPPLLMLVALPLLLLAALVVLACLSGGLVLSAIRSPRAAGSFAENGRRGRFDNPPGLP